MVPFVPFSLDTAIGLFRGTQALLMAVAGGLRLQVPEYAWSRLLAGESGAGEITQFDHSEYPVHFACELKEFDPTQWIDRKAARRMDRFAQMILAAARQAEADSGLDISKEPERVGETVQRVRTFLKSHTPR